MHFFVSVCQAVAQVKQHLLNFEEHLKESYLYKDFCELFFSLVPTVLNYGQALRFFLKINFSSFVWLIFFLGFRENSFEKIYVGMLQLFKVFTFTQSPRYKNAMVVQLLHFNFWKKNDFPLQRLLEHDPAFLNEELGESGLCHLGKTLKNSQCSKNNYQVVRTTFQLNNLATDLNQDFEKKFLNTKSLNQGFISFLLKNLVSK